MKAVLEHLPKNKEESFVVKFFEYTHYPTPWHFHPEYELVLVVESTGKRFIGDHISTFQPGDLALIGPNLPHLYRNDASFYKSDELRAKSIVVHFSPSSFGEQFFSLPEAKLVQELLDRSARGLDVKGNTKIIVSGQLHELLQLTGFSRWLKLLEVLNTLACSGSCNPISAGGITGINEKETDRMDRVLNYVLKNFHKDISLKDAAEVAHMAENSFSRYFSRRTRKRFISYVNEVRLNHASKLLIENGSNILDISLNCGFNNLSNFNKQFKNFYRLSPSAYQKLYLTD